MEPYLFEIQKHLILIVHKEHGLSKLHDVHPGICDEIFRLLMDPIVARVVDYFDSKLFWQILVTSLECGRY